ncbi:SDR family NAD(P)-dependent oxidoreductase [Dinghuibacter silviterrae]|uniref:NAD(P)-dependent dehydrogenase (Short-subunit alcohol dehydrogenase family) n=1 Tax=Dinghuibacter silviterrae TaxID=1539049 RepID=A0A4R8DEJ0_9BACT|nr:SDR family oxidoreductase [Dinghuibacter silviterrae]TDW95951.1 NAD(P)-dependent dehydrogenase (short-subunit alcohol dehydrogenase family) [Dinghuibacter silviterrae]
MVQNNIALVTGGSRGLGKDMVLRLAEKGIDIILTYRTQKDEALAVVAAVEKLGRKAVALPLDVSNASGFEAFFSSVATALRATWGAEKFQFLVNNAGIGIHAAFADTTEAQFDELVNIQFKGPFFLTQRALPYIADGGGIVNISSGLARFSFPGYAAYASMKGAMETLTRYQAKELGARKIRVNIVAPGAIETDFGGGVVRDNAQVNAQIASVTALGRVGLPEDIGGVVAFLCTDPARWINAQRIEVSGGMML